MSEQMFEKLVFNPNGNDRLENRTIIKGNVTNTFNLNETKYNWAKKLYREMLGNFWIPEKVDLTNDKLDYKNKLNKTEKDIMGSILSFLTFLDSIQTTNLTKFVDYITAPEVSTIIQIQDFQEVIHSQSYAYIIESVIPSQERESIYEKWKQSNVLFERNKYIASIYQDFWSDRSEDNFVRTLIANYILESIYFYNGFIFFYNLASRNLMLGVADLIRYINTDEMCFVEGTEILTDQGWKNFQDINFDSKVAQYNMGTKEVNFINPQRIINKEYNGNLINIHNKNNTYQTIITEDHDMVVRHRKYDKNFKIKPTDIKFNFIYDIPVAGKKQNGSRLFSEIDQLLIALQADGTIDKQRTGERMGCQILRFAFLKERKISRLTQILDNLIEFGITYTKNVVASGHTTFYIHYPNSLPIVPDKNFDWLNLNDIDYQYGQSFISELQHWDGYVDEKTTCIYFGNTNEKAINIIQAIGAISGTKIHRTIQIDDRKETFNDIHRLYMYIGEEYKQTQGLIKENIDYNGKVYCVTVPTGAIIVRYKGAVTVSGNCHVTLFANIILTIKQEFPNMIKDELIYQMFSEACQEEIKWSNYILKDSDIIGMNEINTKLYTEFLVNDRLRRIGLEPLFLDSNTNPYKSLELQADGNSDAVKSNFFESSNTNYSMSSVMKGWDKI